MRTILFCLFLLPSLAEAATLTVTARSLERGATIAANDLEQVDNASRPAYAGALDAAALVGKEVRRPVPAGQPLFHIDVQEPLLVKRNQQVTMVLSRGALSIATLGKAMEDGSKGNSVRVQNLVSKQIVEAEVAAPGVVRVNAAVASGIPAGF